MPSSEVTAKHKRHISRSGSGDRGEDQERSGDRLKKEDRHAHQHKSHGHHSKRSKNSDEAPDAHRHKSSKRDATPDDAAAPSRHRSSKRDADVRVKQEPIDDFVLERVKHEPGDDDVNLPRHHHRANRHNRDDERHRHADDTDEDRKPDVREINRGHRRDDGQGRDEINFSRRGGGTRGDRGGRHDGAMFEQRQERQANDRQRLQTRRARDVKHEPEGDHPWGGDRKPDDADDKKPAAPKEKPTLELSGKLAEDTNTFRGVVIKYVEPEEARKPKKLWRFHPFKGDEALPVLHLHRQSAYLLGRDRRICDIPIDHPSCSKQHAALQFRLVAYKRADGAAGRRVCPYVMDLGSANGTYVNNVRVEAQRYVELMEKDVVKFGFSSRDYVLLHASSDTSEIADDEGND